MKKNSTSAFYTAFLDYIGQPTKRENMHETCQRAQFCIQCSKPGAVSHVHPHKSVTLDNVQNQWQQSVSHWLLMQLVYQFPHLPMSDIGNSVFINAFFCMMQLSAVSLSPLWWPGVVVSALASINEVNQPMRQC